MPEVRTGYKFATEKTTQPRKPKTLLDYDMRRSQELGYGPHYGQYKADHPNTRAEFEALTEKKKPQATPREIVCKNCGKTFTKTGCANQFYCSPECKEQGHIESVKRSKEKAKEKRPRAGTRQVCPICGQEFISTHGRKYCTVNCRRQGDRITGARLREKYRQERKNNGND